MLVRALIPVRNGDRDPRAPGEEFDLSEADARALAAIGAVAIVDPEFADAAETRALLESLAEGAINGLSAEAAAALAEERDETRLENERLRSLAGTATEEVLKLRAQVEQLQARIGELEAGAQPPPSQGGDEPPPEVNVKMTLAELRDIAHRETVAFDANDTKAELVTKILAGRQTAKAEA